MSNIVVSDLHLVRQQEFDSSMIELSQEEQSIIMGGQTLPPLGRGVGLSAPPPLESTLPGGVIDQNILRQNQDIINRNLNRIRRGEA